MFSDTISISNSQYILTGRCLSNGIFIVTSAADVRELSVVHGLLGVKTHQVRHPIE